MALVAIGARRQRPDSVRRALAVAGIAVAAFIATTWWALEWDGVAVVETRAANGSLRATHVWYAEADGGLWLEAGSPENGWFRDVQRDPVLSFSVGDRSARYRARAIPGPRAHERIRSLIRERYGFRDWWVNLIIDTSRSVAVQLVPEPE